MSVTVMRHICFIECPYHKSIPPTGKLAMPNFPHYQKKKPAIKLNPMNCPPSTLLPTNVHPVSIYNSSTFPKISSTLEKIMAASDWRKELLCKHDSWHRGSCCGLDVPESPFSVTGVFFGKPFRFSAFRLSGARFEKPVSLVLISLRKTRNCNCDVQFLLVGFLCMGFHGKLEIRHFLESCWWWFRAHFPEILNAMLVAREGRVVFSFYFIKACVYLHVFIAL